MSSKKATKRALLTSILAICLCLVMLIGSTFAWFTDTASTGVNKIQAGNLDVKLEYATAWDEASGEPTVWTEVDENTKLTFRTADNRDASKIFWEPGCTYVLPELRVSNVGNLALKYKIVINGIQGSAKLNEVIDWTMKLGDADFALGSEHHLAAKTTEATASDIFTISGTMDKNAGNTYMNESIDGITITVYATQDTVEADSFGNTYDAMAQYPVEAISSVETKKDANENTVVAKEVVLESAATVKVSETETKPLATATVPAETKLKSDTTSLKLVITKTDEPDNFTVTAGMSATTFDVKVIGVASDNAVVIPVEMYIDKGLSDVKLYHNGEPMEENEFNYDAETGLLTFKTATFSPFTVVYNAPAMTVDGVAYYDLTSAVTAAKEGSTITFCKSTTKPMKLALTAPMTVKNVTFKANAGVVIDGLQLASTSAKTMVTLENVKFEGISFTDVVVIGQDSSSYGLSKCTDITFDSCKFDLSTSTEEHPDAIKRMGGTVSGTISEKEAVAYMSGLTVKNCKFTNVRYGVYCGKVRNTTLENCTFTNCSSYAVRFEDVAGELNLIGNTADKAAGVLTINTVGNNYSTTDIQTNVTIRDNTATGMTCRNGYVFVTAYDNARQSRKSTYTITGNSCTYTQSFDEPLNGFRIERNYSPSKAEFISNT